MKTKAALIITHGNFGKELLKSVEMIMGEQENAAALGLNPGDEVDALRAEAERIVVENEKADKETIVLVDILGGSPSNVALYIFKSHNLKLVTGVNMPMLIEFFSSREYEEMGDLLQKLVDSSVEAIKKFEQ
jgi:PTS system mannose-specific IIA component